jgi:hypothetical protein
MPGAAAKRTVVWRSLRENRKRHFMVSYPNRSHDTNRRYPFSMNRLDAFALGGGHSKQSEETDGLSAALRGFPAYRCSDTSLRMVSFLSAMPSISTSLPA